ncbi:MAG TPA: hypothetical protein VEI02_07030 [Planctomycetota bacterium]|nr:hypothetical protein [Planctomycetota bacterium]
MIRAPRNAAAPARRLRRVGAIVLVGAAALAAPACSEAKPAATASDARPTAAVLTYRFDGKTPGECCVTPVQESLKLLGPGAATTDLRPGEPVFHVTYDPARTTPARIAAALKESGAPIVPSR